LTLVYPRPRIDSFTTVLEAALHNPNARSSERFYNLSLFDYYWEANRNEVFQCTTKSSSQNFTKLLKTRC